MPLCPCCVFLYQQYRVVDRLSDVVVVYGTTSIVCCLIKLQSHIDCHISRLRTKHNSTSILFFTSQHTAARQQVWEEQQKTNQLEAHQLSQLIVQVLFFFQSLNLEVFFGSFLTLSLHIPATHMQQQQQENVIKQFLLLLLFDLVLLRLLPCTHKCCVMA